MSNFSTKVDRTVKAYRGNPEVLDERYKVSKDLADLIAYQQLMEEKEALSKAVMLREGKQPSSIKDQYEKSLVSGSRDSMMDRAARVGNIPQNLQGQRPMPQGIASNPRPRLPQQGQRPMPQGIANNPRPNMRNMAQGGIVGFQAGGGTSQSALQILNQTAQPQQGTYAGPALTPKQMTAMALKQAQSKYGGTGGTGGTGARPINKTTTSTSTTSKSVDDRLKEYGVDKSDINKEILRSDTKEVSDAMGPKAIAAQREMASKDIEEEKTKERDRLTKRYEGVGIQAELQRQIDEQKKLDASATDPAKMKKDDRNAILRGMALGGVRGSTIAQNKLAANRAKGDQERIDRVRKMTNEKNVATLNLLKDADAGAADAFKVYAEMQSKAFDSLKGLSSADIAAREQRFANDIKYDQGKMGNILRAVQAQVAEDTRKLTQESLTLQQLNSMIVAQAGAIQKTEDMLLKSQELTRARIDSELRNAQNLNSDKGRERIAAAKAELKILDQKILDATMQYSSLMEKMTGMLENMMDQ